MCTVLYYFTELYVPFVAFTVNANEYDENNKGNIRFGIKMKKGVQIDNNRWKKLLNNRFEWGKKIIVDGMF